MEPAEELRKARALILEHGWNATAYQILNPGLQLWFSRVGHAVAGYRDWVGIRVVAGAPVCPAERLAAAVDELEADAARAGCRVCYFAAGARLEGLLGARAGYSKAGIGAQPVWDPGPGADIVGDHPSLRAQLHRASNKGVTVREWPADEAGGDAGIRRCLEEWLGGRHMPPMGFLVEPRTLARIWDRRVFVAERAGRPVAFLVASPVPGREGWLIEQMVRGTAAPNGTVESLVDAAFRAAHGSGIRYFTLGLAPLTRVAEENGNRNPLWLDLAFSWLRAHGSRYYDFEGLERFKSKFRPGQWEPIYAICRGSFSPRVLLAVAAAFAGGSPFRFLAGAFAKASRQELAWLAERLRPWPTEDIQAG